MKLPETLTVGDVMNLMDKALTLEGAEQKELVEALLARGEHARENLGYLTGYFDRERAHKLLTLFDTEHPVFGRRDPSAEEAFQAGVALGKKADRA